MHPDTALEKCQTLINKYSWTVLRRLRAAGVRSAELDDIRQELLIAWMNARSKWNPELGVPFGPYLMNGMKMHIFRWAKYEIEETQFAPFSLDKPISEDGDATVGDQVAADEDKPIEQRMHEDALRKRVMDRLSGRAALFFLLLTDPPDELLDVFKAMRAKAAYAQKIGVPTFVPAQITEALIFDVMGASRPERTKLKKAVEAAANQVSISLRF